jgi:hypothetical protein
LNTKIASKNGKAVRRIRMRDFDISEGLLQ